MLLGYLWKVFCSQVICTIGGAVGVFFLRLTGSAPVLAVDLQKLAYSGHNGQAGWTSKDSERLLVNVFPYLGRDPDYLELDYCGSPAIRPAKGASL